MTTPQNGHTQPATSSVANTGTNYIDSLLDDIKWGGVVGTGAVLTYSFPWSALTTAYWATNPDYSALGEPSAAAALNLIQQVAARAALTSWSNIANLTFTAVTESVSSVGDIRFAWTDKTEPGAAAWAYMPDNYHANGGDVWLSKPAIGSYPLSFWLAGEYGYSILIHELGHALGLKHPFAGSPVLSAGQDSKQYSVMSYTDHAHNLFRRVTAESHGSYSFDYIYVEPETPMLYDIAAIQYLYGRNTTYHAGNDTYTFDLRTPFFRTIWDAGGTDTISVSNFAKGCNIDLQAGRFSKITIESDPLPSGYVGGSVPTYDGTDNLAIAFGTVIENAVGGSGFDTLTGNTADNTLTGGGGNDFISGGAGLDTAVFSGPKGSYTVTRTAGTVTVRDNVGTDGMDTLTGMERLQFSTPANPVYRFENPYNGAFLFTATESERQSIVRDYSFLKAEGVSFHVLDLGQGAPVYRFANTYTGGYFYTATEAEKTYVIDHYPAFRFEGAAFALPSSMEGLAPVERFANHGTGAHLLTLDATEIASLRANAAWHDEGIAFHALAVSSYPDWVTL